MYAYIYIYICICIYIYICVSMHRYVHVYLIMYYTTTTLTSPHPFPIPGATIPMAQQLAFTLFFNAALPPLPIHTGSIHPSHTLRHLAFIFPHVCCSPECYPPLTVKQYSPDVPQGVLYPFLSSTSTSMLVHIFLPMNCRLHN